MPSLFHSSAPADCWLRHIIAVVLLGMLCATIYANGMFGAFLFDDLPNIVDNPHMQVTTLDPSAWYLAAISGPSSDRPVANLTFAANHYLSGFDVFGFHVVNVIVHWVNGVLVYFVAVQLWGLLRTLPGPAGKLRVAQGEPPPGPSLKKGGGIKATLRRRAKNRDCVPSGEQTKRHTPLPLVAFLFALLAAGFFVAHPLQTQSVTYIVQRMNSLAVMFYLLAWLCYMLGRKTPSPGRRWTLWAACLVAWLLALGCKPIAATLPLLILVYELYFPRDLDLAWIRRRVRYLLAAVLVVGLVGWWFLGLQPPGEFLQEGYALREFTPAQRLMTQPRVIAGYLGAILVPLPSLLILTPHVVTSTSLLSPATTLPSLLLLVGLLVAAVKFARPYRLASFCVVWFFLHLGIESSIFPLEMAFQHRTYLPLVGVALAVGWLLSLLATRFLTVSLVGGTALILVLGFLAHQRNLAYRSPLIMWADVVTKAPDDYRGHYNLGVALDDLGRYVEAVECYTRSLSIHEKYFDAYTNRGIDYMRLGLAQQALDDFNQAIALDPDSARVYNNRGGSYSQLNEFESAFTDYARAIELDPEFAEPHFNRADDLRFLGRRAEAIEDYSRALQIFPGYTEAWLGRGISFAEQKEYERAIRDLSVAIELQPDHAEAYFFRGTCLGRQQQAALALRDFDRLLELRPDHTEAYRSRAVQHFVLRDYDAAWRDVLRCRELGGEVLQDFVEQVRAARNGGD